MKKEFTLKNYFVYVCRYWLITAICAVIGMGAMIFYGIMSKPDEEVVYEGSVSIVGLGSFYGSEDMSDVSETYVEAYDKMCDYALSVMSGQKVGNDLYRELMSEWRTIHPKFNASAARTEFFDALSVSRSSYSVTITFTQTDDSEKYNAFAQKAINRYIELAIAEAKATDIMLGADGRLIPVNAMEKLTTNQGLGLGLAINAAEGLLIGIILGLIVMIVMYFADKRINSYGDIAELTGGRLLGVSRQATGREVCPQIERFMDKGKGTLLVTGSIPACTNVSGNYAAYCVDSGYKTLMIDFSKGKDDLGEFLGGKAYDECAKSGDGYDVLCGAESWMKLAKEYSANAAVGKFERIVICAPYTGDGSVSALAGISDKVVYAVDQQSWRIKDAVSAAHEVRAFEKAIGAVIDGVGKSFVGGDTYFAQAEEE